MVLSPKDLAPFVERISAILQDRPLRTIEAIEAAGIDDVRVGEDAIWQLIQRGEVRIAPDSTLRWVKQHGQGRVVLVGKKTSRAGSRQKSAAG